MITELIASYVSNSGEIIDYKYNRREEVTKGYIKLEYSSSFPSVLMEEFTEINEVSDYVPNPSYPNVTKLKATMPNIVLEKVKKVIQGKEGQKIELTSYESRLLIVEEIIRSTELKDEGDLFHIVGLTDVIVNQDPRKTSFEFHFLVY